MNPNQQYDPNTGQPYQPAPQQPLPPQAPQQPQQPMFNQPFIPPDTTGQQVVLPQIAAATTDPDGRPKGVKKPINKAVLGLSVAVAVLLLLVITLFAVVASKPKPATTTQSTNTSKDASSDTADAEIIQQTDNLISQDISGLNTEQDFSASVLDKTKLQL